MEKRFKEPNRDQMLLRPTDLDKLASLDHPVRAVWDFVSKLDLSRIEEKYGAYEGEAGRTPFSPRLMLALWLYAYMDKAFSCRELEQRCKESAPYIWLCGGIEPNYHTLSDFRSSNAEEFDEVLTKSLALLDRAGLIELDEIFHDGTKVKASAGVSSARKRGELEMLLEKARKVVERLNGMSDEERAGLGRRKAAARERAARERVERIEKALEEYSVRVKRRKAHGLDPEATRVSTTDPESNKMMHSDGGYRHSYNAQIAMDGASGVVVGVGITNEMSDAHQLLPIVEQVKDRFGMEACNWVNDSGYNNGVNLKEMEDMDTKWWCPSMGQVAKERGRKGDRREGFNKKDFKYNDEGDYYECPAGKRLLSSGERTRRGRRVIIYKSEECGECEHRATCTPNSKKGRSLQRGYDEALMEKMEERMSRAEGRLMMKKRRCISEWGMAQIKSVMGWKEFMLRGIKKTLGELRMVALAHNIKIWAKQKWRFTEAAMAT
jgi:transposase